MQHDNNIENKLRQMEAMEQPDLGQMEEHWQQMAGMLQPAVLPVKKVWPEWMLNMLSAAAVVVLIIIAALYFTSGKDKKSDSVLLKNDTENVTPKQNENNIPAPFITDVAGKETNTGLDKPKINPSLIYQYKNKGNGDIKDWTEEDSILGTIKLNYTPCETCPAKMNVAAPQNQNSNQYSEKNTALMNSFFSAIEKPLQNFNVDTDTDTTIVCENGTRILIPAGIFLTKDSSAVKGAITIKVKEFYSYEDIISSKLSTISNGEQLISGGMVYITATQNGNELKVAPQKQLSLKMPVNKPYDEEMQLFTAEQVSYNLDLHTDTASGKNINWQPAGQYQKLKSSKFMIKVFDPYGQPYKVYEKKNGIKVAKFVIRDDCKMSNKEVLAALQGHFGMFYNKIKLRRSLSDNPRPLFSKKPYPVVGDSLEIELAKAIKMNILSKEEVEKYEQQMLKDSLAWSDKLNSIPFYEFQVGQLGYFNCDRFGNTTPRINYTLNLTETNGVQNLFSVLAFDRYRSVLPGYAGPDKLMFMNVPKGEKVHVISVGVKDGQIVSCVQPFTISEYENELQYTETTPMRFREQLKELHLQ